MWGWGGLAGPMHAFPMACHVMHPASRFAGGARDPGKAGRYRAQPGHSERSPVILSEAKILAEVPVRSTLHSAVTLPPAAATRNSRAATRCAAAEKSWQGQSLLRRSEGSWLKCQCLLDSSLRQQ